MGEFLCLSDIEWRKTCSSFVSWDEKQSLKITVEVMTCKLVTLTLAKLVTQQKMIFESRALKKLCDLAMQRNSGFQQALCEEVLT